MRYLIIILTLIGLQIKVYADEINLSLVNSSKKLLNQSNQNKEYTSFVMYNFDYRWNNFIFGVQNNQKSSTSTEGNISIKSDFNETNFILGYMVYRYFIYDNLVEFRINGYGVIGTTQVANEYRMESVQYSDSSDNYSNMGLGASLEVKIKYFHLAFDQSISESAAYSPQSYYSYAIRSGLTFEF